MVLKFCPNLNFLFTEGGVGLAERYLLAHRAGFRGVEGPCPSAATVDSVLKAKSETGLEQVLLNLYTEGATGAEQVCAAHPTGIEQFRKNFEYTVKVAKSLKCRKIHVMAGIHFGDDRQKQTEVYLSNLKYAAKLLEAESIVGVIEPINKYAVPGYFLNSFTEAVRLLDAVNSPNLKLMIDVYHLQHIQGNVTNALHDLKHYIGHFQIAQVPNRHEPNVRGELDYGHIFQEIENVGYSDWVGCEYKPKSDTVSGLGWIKEYGYSL